MNSTIESMAKIYFNNDFSAEKDIYMFLAVALDYGYILNYDGYLLDENKNKVIDKLWNNILNIDSDDLEDIFHDLFAQGFESNMPIWWDEHNDNESSTPWACPWTWTNEKDYFIHGLSATMMGSIWAKNNMLEIWDSIKMEF